ncbi:MAG: response regulator [Candidatus Bathyarchaeota archaeon]|nr:response regulator [Candidatus Bathyarchaeota archaeon]
MGTKILVVDDSAFTRRIVRNALNGRGFREVIEAENGEEALRKYETEKPDVVLLDIIVPGLDGTEVLKRIMNIDENAKVIMLTAVGQAKTMKTCNILGSAGYIVKPFDERQLVDTVEETLRAKGKRKRTAKLTKLEEDALREVGHIGAQHAGTALSKMIGQTVKVKLLTATMTSLDDLPKLVGDRETLVSGIYLPVTGDLSGSLLMIFPEKSAFILVNVLLKKEPGTTKELDEMDKSALSEAGNILAGNCLTALSHTLGMHLVEHVPEFAHGMVGALLDNVAVAFGQKAERALIIQVELSTRAKIKVMGYFFLLFSLKEAHAMLRALGAKVVA